jgi:hypothetical protein
LCARVLKWTGGGREGPKMEKIGCRKGKRGWGTRRDACLVN